MNFVNQRREFFNVSLDEIKQVIKDNYDKSVEFVELAPAEQYRESLKLKEQMKKKCVLNKIERQSSSLHPPFTIHL